MRSQPGKGRARRLAREGRERGQASAAGQARRLGMEEASAMASHWRSGSMTEQGRGGLNGLPPRERRAGQLVFVRRRGGEGWQRRWWCRSGGGGACAWADEEDRRALLLSVGHQPGYKSLMFDLCAEKKTNMGFFVKN